MAVKAVAIKRRAAEGYVLVGTTRPKRVPTTVITEMIILKSMLIPKYRVKSQLPLCTSISSLAVN